MKRFLPILALVSAAAFTQSTIAQPASTPIYIASSVPLTGGAASFGTQSRWGTELAVAQANAAGGVNGRKLEVDFSDNRCNPAEAVKSVTRMLSDKKYVALLDGLCSSVALAIMPLAERSGMPFVVANASATAIAEKAGAGGNKWTFKINPTDASLMDALVGWVEKNGSAANIAFLGEDTDFGRAGQSGLAGALKKRGLALASSDFYQQGLADFSTPLSKVRAKKPSLLAIQALDTDFQNIIQQWNGMGAGIPLTGRVYLDQIPEAIVKSGGVDGSLTVQPYSATVDLPANKAFVDAYKARFNELPTIGSHGAYEATRVLIDALKRAKSTEPEALREAIAQTQLPALLGGTLQFDDHNLAHGNAVVQGIKAGRLAILGFSKT